MDSSIFERVWIIMKALNGLEWIDWLHVKNMGKLHRRAVAGLDSWKILDSRSSRARIFSFCLLKPDPRHLMAFSLPINVHLEAYRNINCFLFLLQMPKTDPPISLLIGQKKLRPGLRTRGILFQESGYKHCFCQLQLPLKCTACKATPPSHRFRA